MCYFVGFAISFKASFFPISAWWNFAFKSWSFSDSATFFFYWHTQTWVFALPSKTHEKIIREYRNSFAARSTSHFCRGCWKISTKGVKSVNQICVFVNFLRISGKLEKYMIDLNSKFFKALMLKNHIKILSGFSNKICSRAWNNLRQTQTLLMAFIINLKLLKHFFNEKSRFNVKYIFIIMRCILSYKICLKNL